MMIVALNNILPDEINSKIAKFVDVKPHPLSVELKYLMSKFNFKRNGTGMTFSEYMFVDVLHCCSCNRLIKGKMLEIHNDLCEECEAELP